MSGKKLDEYKGVVFVVVAYMAMVIITGRVFFHFISGKTPQEDDAFLCMMYGIAWPITVPFSLIILLLVGIAKTLMFLIAF